MSESYNEQSKVDNRKTLEAIRNANNPFDIQKIALQEMGPDAYVDLIISTENQRLAYIAACTFAVGSNNWERLRPLAYPDVVAEEKKQK